MNVEPGGNEDVVDAALILVVRAQRGVPAGDAAETDAAAPPAGDDSLHLAQALLAVCAVPEK